MSNIELRYLATRKNPRDTRLVEKLREQPLSHFDLVRLGVMPERARQIQHDPVLVANAVRHLLTPAFSRGH